MQTIDLQVAPTPRSCTFICFGDQGVAPRKEIKSVLNNKQVFAAPMCVHRDRKRRRRRFDGIHRVVSSMYVRLSGRELEPGSEATALRSQIAERQYIT